MPMPEAKGLVGNALYNAQLALLTADRPGFTRRDLQRMVPPLAKYIRDKNLQLSPEWMVVLVCGPAALRAVGVLPGGDPEKGPQPFDEQDWVEVMGEMGADL